MSTMSKLHTAVMLLKEIPYLEKCDMVGMIHRSDVPDSYSLKEEMLFHGHRILVYDMGLIGKKSYFIDIKNVGFFQIM